jgi:hypothetical protein
MIWALLTVSLHCAAQTASSTGSATIPLPPESELADYRGPAFTLRYPSAWTILPGDLTGSLTGCRERCDLEIVLKDNWGDAWEKKESGWAYILIQRTRFNLPPNEVWKDAASYVKLSNYEGFIAEQDCAKRDPKAPPFTPNRYPSPTPGCGHALWSGAMPYGRGLIVKAEQVPSYPRLDPKALTAEFFAMRAFLSEYDLFYDIPGQGSIYTFELMATQAEAPSFLPYLYAVALSFHPDGVRKRKSVVDEVAKTKKNRPAR